MKKVLLMIFCSLLLCGCAGKQKNVSLSAMSNDVVSLSAGLVQVPLSEIPSYFALSEADFEGCIVFVSLSGERADEIAVFKAYDEQGLENIVAAVNARLRELRSSFRDYVPSEFAKLEKTVIRTNGLYCYYSVSDDDDVKRLISRYFS